MGIFFLQRYNDFVKLGFEILYYLSTYTYIPIHTLIKFTK